VFQKLALLFELYTPKIARWMVNALSFPPTNPQASAKLQTQCIRYQNYQIYTPSSKTVWR
jgi:hypothetical protein